jgi:hypothetical protein
LRRLLLAILNAAFGHGARWHTHNGETCGFVALFGADLALQRYRW